MTSGEKYQKVLEAYLALHKERDKMSARLDALGRMVELANIAYKEDLGDWIVKPLRPVREEVKCRICNTMPAELAVEDSAGVVCWILCATCRAVDPTTILTVAADVGGNGDGN